MEPSAQERNTAARTAAATIAIVAAATLAVFATMCRGAAPDGAEERCARILDRYVELRQRAVDPKTPGFLVEEKQRDARAAAGQEGALLRCTRSISVESAACADKANTADELERCFP
jgi:hypothetical protein